MKIFYNLLCVMVALTTISSCKSHSAAEPNTSQISNGSSLKPSPALPTIEDKDRVLKGEKLYRTMMNKYHMQLAYGGQLAIGGFGERIILSSPTNEWKAFSKEEQINISLYAESLIPLVRANPEKFLVGWIPKTAPAYDTFVSNASRMCDTCWQIDVGRLIRDKDGFDIEPDTTAVSGNDAMKFRKALR